MAPLAAPVSTPDDFYELSLTNSTAQHVLPSKTLSFRTLVSDIIARQATTVSTVPQTYGAQQDGPDPGTIVGIVLGSVAGFLLVVWLFYTCLNLGNGPTAPIDAESVGTASVVTRKSRRHRKHHHHHSSRSPRRETVEVRRERMTPATGGERIIIEERSRSRPPPSPMPPPPPPPADTDDEVVVIEEHSPPRRRESRRKSRRNSDRRSSGGQYRDVDPYLYAGGDAPPRDISRRRSDSRR